MAGGETSWSSLIGTDVNVDLCYLSHLLKCCKRYNPIWHVQLYCLHFSLLCLTDAHRFFWCLFGIWNFLKVLLATVQIYLVKLWSFVAMLLLTLNHCVEDWFDWYWLNRWCIIYEWSLKMSQETFANFFQNNCLVCISFYKVWVMLIASSDIWSRFEACLNCQYRLDKSIWFCCRISNNVFLFNFDQLVED